MSTTRYLKKVDIVMIEINEETKMVAVAVKYFTRRLWGKVLDNKRAVEFVRFLKELSAQGKKPEKIVTDNGREFCNTKMIELCRPLNINHKKVGIESHKSNIELERLIMTIRENIW